MKKELEAKLKEAFPKIFKLLNIGVPDDKTLYWDIQYLGFRCEDGWFDIIWRLCENLNPLVEKQKKDHIYAVQVKEKFAGLRFYTNGTLTDEMRKHIRNAEDESYKTCEICGKKGKKRSYRSYIATHCDECYKKEKERRYIEDED